MTVANLLLQKRSIILEKWYDLILKTYPADSNNFFKREKDRFANPIGYTFTQELEKVLGFLLDNVSQSEFKNSLEKIIKIRAVQDFSPSDAVSFIFLLKGVIRDLFKENSGDISGEIIILENRIDNLALQAFDLYMECREKIFNIRINEIKNISNRVLKQANLLYEGPEEKDANQGLSNHC